MRSKGLAIGCVLAAGLGADEAGMPDRGSERPISASRARVAFELLNREPVVGWAEAQVGLQ
jgi:hypothetical protein